MRTFLFFYLFCLFCSAQKLRTFTDSQSLVVQQVAKGDTVRNMCDSLFLLNAKTYRTYQTAYNTLRQKKDLDAKLLEMFGESLTTSLRRIESQNLDFANLQQLTHKVLDDSKTNAQQTQVGLLGIDKHLAQADASLNEVNKRLGEALKHIKTARRQRIKIFGSGVLVGLSTAILSNLLIK